VEKKSFKELSLVLKAEDFKEGRVSGYAAWFGNVDRHGDILMPKSLKNEGARVPLLWNHDPNQVIGSVHITEDEKGYRYDGSIAIHSANEEIRRKANWVYSLIHEGHVNRNSFGFIVEEGRWETRKIDGKQRQVFLITKADVAEVSIVPMPANPRAGVTNLKSHDEIKRLERRIVELENELKRLSPENKNRMSKKRHEIDISDAILWRLF
jgi:HK97 family phage prohead protease